jgi:hypothetical protein
MTSCRCAHFPAGLVELRTHKVASVHGPTVPSGCVSRFRESMRSPPNHGAYQLGHKVAAFHLSRLQQKSSTYPHGARDTGRMSCWHQPCIVAVHLRRLPHAVQDARSDLGLVLRQEPPVVLGDHIRRILGGVARLLV